MLDEIIADSTLPHEGAPHGVPLGYAWQAQAYVPDNEIPEGWIAAVPWGDVYVDASGIRPPNTRVEIGCIELQILSLSTGTWRSWRWSDLTGSWYPENFQGTPIAGDLRTEPQGDVSVTAGDGYTFHFFPKNRIRVDPDDVEGVVATVWHVSSSPIRMGPTIARVRGICSPQAAIGGRT